MEPILIGGAAILALYFFLSGDDKKATVVPRKPPVVPPPVQVTNEADEANAAALLAAHEAGVADGYEAGLDDGSAGAAHNPQPTTVYPAGEAQAVYVSAFTAGYSLGYDEGLAAKKQFTGVATNAAAEGRAQGLAQGKIDAINGDPHAPNPPYQSTWDSEMNAVYQTNYMNGYSQAYAENYSPAIEVAGVRSTTVHYAKVAQQHHAAVTGLAANNGGRFKNILLTATVNGLNVEAAVLGEPRRIAGVAGDVMPAVVMSAGPYHGHKLVIVDG